MSLVQAAYSAWNLVTDESSTEVDRLHLCRDVFRASKGKKGYVEKKKEKEKEKRKKDPPPRGSREEGLDF